MDLQLCCGLVAGCRACCVDVSRWCLVVGVMIEVCWFLMFGCWLRFRFWVLGVLFCGFWFLVFGVWLLGFGFWLLVVGF